MLYFDSIIADKAVSEIEAEENRLWSFGIFARVLIIGSVEELDSSINSSDR